MKKIAFITLLLIFGVSCTTVHVYKYISLEKIEGIRITSYGSSNLHGLESDEEMPIRYELKREDYVLIMMLDVTSYWPSIFVSSRLIDGSNLLIEEVSIGNCGSFDSGARYKKGGLFFGSGVRYKKDGLFAARYSWSPAFHSKCVVDGNQDYSDEQIIGFRIKNQRGAILGEERLPFILVTNGIYYEIDAP